MLRKLQKRAAPENQLSIPGIDLPPVITLRKPDPGSRKRQQPQRIRLWDCTLPQLKQYRKELLQTLKSDRRVQEVDKAIQFMEKHVPHSRKKTFGQVAEQYQFDFEAETV